MNSGERPSDRIVVIALVLSAIAQGCSLASGGGRLTVGIELMAALPLSAAWCAVKQKESASAVRIVCRRLRRTQRDSLVALGIPEYRRHTLPNRYCKRSTAQNRGALCARRRHRPRLVVPAGCKPLTDMGLPAESRGSVFRVGLMPISVAIGLYWLKVQQLGGLVTFLGTNRVKGYELMQDTLSLAEVQVTCASIALLFLGSEGSKKTRRRSSRPRQRGSTFLFGPIGLVLTKIAEEPMQNRKTLNQVLAKHQPAAIYHAAA